MLAKLDDHRMLLLEAADVIEKNGLQKGGRGRIGAPMCLHGALAFIAYGDPRYIGWGEEIEPRTAYGRACILVRDYLRSTGVSRELACDNGCAPWNNAPERTAADVASALRNAAMAMAH